MGTRLGRRCKTQGAQHDQEEDRYSKDGGYPQRFIHFLNRKPEPTAFLVSPTLPLAITDQVDNGFGRRIDLDSLISIPSRYCAPFVPFMMGRRSWEQERHTQGLDRGRLIASSAWS
jgi:hypothetical protein